MKTTITTAIVDNTLQVEIKTNEPIHPKLEGQLRILIGRFCKYAIEGKLPRPEELFLASIILGGGGAENLLEAIKSATTKTQPA
jgi:hypothetical protein